MRNFSSRIHFILLMVVVASALSSTVRAQTLFQNNNSICESENVLCATATGTCLASNLTSIACKNATASADFNNDGFVDCAASSPTLISPTGTPDFSSIDILMNQAGSAVDCSSGTGDQFNPAQNEELNYGLPFAEITTIVTGRIDGNDFSDLAVARADTFNQPAEADVISAFSPGAAGYPPNVDITSSSANWVANDNQFGFNSAGAQNSLALIQCGNANALDAVIVVGDSSGTNSLRMNLLRNNGAGLQDIAGIGDSFDVNVGAVFEPEAAVAVADFNNDAIPDTAVMVDDSSGGPVQAIAICINDGNCGFSCTQQVDLAALYTSPQPFSIAAGDFNGDTNQDVVVSLPGLPTGTSGVHYFFGDGGGNLTSPGVDVPFTGGAFDGEPLSVTTGCFNNDNVVDVAASYSNPAPTSGSSDVRVVTSDGSGGFDPVLTLTLNLVAGDFVNNALGIDAADFDNAGGDDIVALATQFNFGVGPSQRRAYVFMNSIEDIVAEAGPDQAADTGDPVAVTGANCSVNPNDPNALFDVQWTVSPPVGSVLSGGDTLAPTFTGNLAGDYTLTLTCTTRCDDFMTDTKIITVVGAPIPTPSLLPVPFDTQGGCISSLIPEGDVPMKNAWLFLAFLPLAYAMFRFKSRKFKAVLLLLVGISLVSTSSHGLTKSFSVNTFEPTVDDSEYFTVYNSPTMLKRNFHVGFFLDYARNTYEFGNANFNRTGGIVEDLLTGNVVGSYGVLDWLSVGVLIPVYFWEGISSNNPAFLVNENNFDLGDVQLVLKFRLLDREKHHVGIAVVPFLIIPTSTGTVDFLGQGAVNGGGKIVIDGRIKDRVSLALNFGYVTRSNIVDIGGNELDDQFVAGLGISVDILKNKLMFIAEAQMATVAKDFFQSRRTTPAEARGGFRYTFANNHDINAGVGFGLSNGIGSPSWRAILGYTYTKRPIADVAVPPPPISDVNVGDELTLQDKIYFEFDKAVIRDISKPTLDKVAGFLKAHPEVTKIKIDGNTCDLGTDAYNMRLSQKRAKAAADYLIGQGIDPSRIGTVEGFGERNPIVPNTDEQHREQNRRVQIFVEAVNK